MLLAAQPGLSPWGRRLVATGFAATLRPESCVTVRPSPRLSSACSSKVSMPGLILKGASLLKSTTSELVCVGGSAIAVFSPGQSGMSLSYLCQTRGQSSNPHMSTAPASGFTKVVCLHLGTVMKYRSSVCRSTSVQAAG